MSEMAHPRVADSKAKPSTTSGHPNARDMPLTHYTGVLKLWNSSHLKEHWEFDPSTAQGTLLQEVCTDSSSPAVNKHVLKAQDPPQGYPALGSMIGNELSPGEALGI